MERPSIIRRQNEVQLRYDLTLGTAEANEYLLQLDEQRDYREIDRTAKLYLSYLLRNIGRTKWAQVRDGITQFIAWKWLLGHEDADTFSVEDPRLDYLYLKSQIESGRWDELTTRAFQERGSK